MYGLGAYSGERHLVFECAALQPVHGSVRACYLNAKRLGHIPVQEDINALGCLLLACLTKP